MQLLFDAVMRSDPVDLVLQRAAEMIHRLEGMLERTHDQVPIVFVTSPEQRSHFLAKMSR